MVAVVVVTIVCATVVPAATDAVEFVSEVRVPLLVVDVVVSASTIVTNVQIVVAVELDSVAGGPVSAVDVRVTVAVVAVSVDGSLIGENVEAIV